jgi:membrane fusion protein, heavy metal efflux system
VILRHTPSLTLLLCCFVLAAHPGCGGSPEAPPGAGGGAAPAQEAQASPADWCGGHGVPESVCTRCNPRLIPEFQARGDWCAEHGLPESQCTICHPELIEKFRKMAPAAASSSRGEDLPAPGPVEGLKVRLATPETAAKAGILTEPVRDDAVALSVSVPARLAFDASRSGRVSSPLAGTVREVHVAAGSRLRSGQPLLVLASPELSEASSRLRDAEAAMSLARQTLEREEHLVALRASAKKDLLEAERQYRAAEASLAGARGVLDSLGTGSADTRERLVLRAPAAGVVTRVEASVGQAVASGQLLVEIHDPSRLWAELDLPERDAARIREGSEVSLSFDALPGMGFSGRIDWVSPEVSATTRTVRARAVVENPDGALRAGMFGRAQVRLETRHGILVPGEAVQDTPDGPVAFVQIEPQVYEPRPLRLGQNRNGRVEVLGGLRPGEMVVTQGSFLLKTEIMKGSLGAGCCDGVEK